MILFSTNSRKLKSSAHSWRSADELDAIDFDLAVRSAELN